MSSTLRKLQSFGCSLSGFQALIRRYDGCDGFETYSDADFSSFTYENYCTGHICGATQPWHINCLPDEVLVIVFSYLSAKEISQSVLPVCKYWYKLGNDPKLWHSLEFCYRSELSLYHMARMVSHRSHQIRSITLKNFSSPNAMDKMMWTIGNNCSRLKQLQLQNCSLRSETLMRLGMTCPRIESLSLICCDENYRKSHYTKAYMKDVAFVATFPRLTSLILFRSLTALSYEDAKHIVRFCANLKRLVLDCDFYGRAIRLLINSLQHTMEVLWLQGRNYNDAMCQEIARCRHLRELGLSHVENITPFGLNFIQRLPRLEKLLLFHAHRIGPPAFERFFASENLKNLSYVNLNGCKGASRDVEKTIRRNCPRIREIIFRVQSCRETAYVDFGIYSGSSS